MCPRVSITPSHAGQYFRYVRNAFLVDAKSDGIRQQRLGREELDLEALPARRNERIAFDPLVCRSLGD